MAAVLESWQSMLESERLWIVRRLLHLYVQSPSLKHLRHETSLSNLAQEIVKAIEPTNRLWQKWNKDRELIIQNATGCWAPVPDLHAFLNSLPGPKLTLSDVKERLRHEEDTNADWPTDSLKEGCLALYEREKSEGTEFFAILRALKSHIEQEKHRQDREREAAIQKALDAKYLADVNRLMSGADTKWVRLKGSLASYIRLNGRTYRLSPCSNRKWRLHRVLQICDEEKGIFIGRYGGRRDAIKVIEVIAFKEDLK